jgi:O-antigen ligase
VNRLLSTRAPLDTPRILFLLAVLLQIGFLISVVRIHGDDTFALLLAGALLTPFVLMALFLWPLGVLLSIPLLVVIPGWIFGFAFFEFVLLVALFLAALRHLSSGHTMAMPPALEWVFILYVAWAGFTLVEAANLKEALVGWKNIVMLFLAFLAGHRLLGAPRARALLRSVAFLAPVISLELAAVLIHRGLPLSFLLTRSTALTDLGWGYSNYIAAVAALSTACAVPLAFYGERWERILGVLSLGSAVFVSIATISRGGTLAILFGILIAAAIEVRRRFFLAVGILAILGGAYFMSPLGQASIARFLDPDQLPSIGARLLYYQETIRIIRDHPFLGVAPNQIPHHSTIEIDPNPHNFVLKNAADLGLPGLALYLVMLGMAAYAAFRLLRTAVDRNDRMVALSFMLTVIIAVTNASYEPTLESSVYGTVFWITVGTCYGAYRFARVQDESA